MGYFDGYVLRCFAHIIQSLTDLYTRLLQALSGKSNHILKSFTFTSSQNRNNYEIQHAFRIKLFEIAFASNFYSKCHNLDMSQSGAF